MVCQSRLVLSTPENKLEDVIEIALVRQTYAGWCGGTAAFAASYPISPLGSRSDSEGLKATDNNRSAEGAASFDWP